MPYKVKKCPCYMTACYADGREVKGECMNSTSNELCQDVEKCVIKDTVDGLFKVTGHQLCERCDGCGCDNGCGDEECGTYQAHRILDFLGVELTE